MKKIVYVIMSFRHRTGDILIPKKMNNGNLKWYKLHTYEKNHYLTFETEKEAFDFVTEHNLDHIKVKEIYINM